MTMLDLQNPVGLSVDACARNNLCIAVWRIRWA